MSSSAGRFIMKYLKLTWLILSSRLQLRLKGNFDAAWGISRREATAGGQS
jgi:hypothetical protein